MNDTIHYRATTGATAFPLLNGLAPGEAPSQLMLTAIHEAGHVVAAITLGRPVVAVDIAAVSGADGTTFVPPTPWMNLDARQRATSLREEMTILAAGAVAIRLYCPGAEPGDGDDYHDLIAKAYLLVGRLAAADVAHAEAEAARLRAEKLIADRWPHVVAIAERLLQFHQTRTAVAALPRLTVDELDPGTIRKDVTDEPAAGRHHCGD